MTEEELEGLSPLGRAAVWYCENGFGIFPLKPKSKEPATVHGLNDWFDDPESAKELWGRNPNYNIGIVCGVPSHGLLVLDFDVSDTKNGIETLRTWQATNGDLPDTSIAITGSGGRHYLYRTSRTNIKPSANAQLGVDVRCDGSYIVAPPSIHPNGDQYEWWESPEDTPIATADDSVYDFLDHVQRNGGVDEDKPQQDHFELPERIKKGERDNTLARYGFSLRGMGYPDDMILAALDFANRERCVEPLDSRDVKRIARSVCKKGPGHDGEGTFVGEGQTVGKFGGNAEITSYRTDKGKLIPNMLGEYIVQHNHACYIDGALAVWNGMRWVFDTRSIEYLCLEYAPESTSIERTEVLKYLTVKTSQQSAGKMDEGYYVQFLNCTWDVKNDCEVEPTPDMYITNTIPLNLDLDAPYGIADRFLDSISGGDSPTRQAMQEIIGVCMCCKRIISQSPMLIGRPTGGTSTAANGKSTFIDVIRHLLGDENVASLDIAALGDRYGPAELMGKLANLGDDIPDGFLHGNELSLFKKLVTGNKIKAERKYQHPFDFKPNATMVFSMNAMPRLADTTDGVFRRLAFVPFRRTFTPDDPDFEPHIIEKLTTDEALQRFAVLGLFAAHDLVSSGRDRLTEIPDMVEEVEEIRIDNSIVRRWIYDENIDAASIDHRAVRDVYQEFVDWCDDAGEKFAPKRATFVKEILATIGNGKETILLNPSTGKKARTFLMGQ